MTTNEKSNVVMMDQQLDTVAAGVVVGNNFEEIKAALGTARENLRMARGTQEELFGGYNF